jgi:hypothetical protein
MRKKPSVAGQVRRMIDQGHTNKAIIDKLGVKPQIVYNIRYQINKARGLGAIGAVVPAPAEGIGAPPKRKYTRRVKAGTGINPSAAQPEPYAITMYEPPEPMWKVRLKNFARALGWRG